MCSMENNKSYHNSILTRNLLSMYAKHKIQHKRPSPLKEISNKFLTSFLLGLMLKSTVKLVLT